MGLEPPSSLSPSKVATFTNCALQFRYSAVDRRPEQPSPAAVRGTLVHAALERLFALPASEREPVAAERCLVAAWEQVSATDEFAALELDEHSTHSMRTEATKMLGRYFALEDPRTVHPIGLELRLEVAIGGVLVRGIIDRLELDDDGGLVVTDYKTGRAPAPRQEGSRLSGVHIYSLMCERLFGRRPARVQLMYLGSSPQFVVTSPSDGSSRGLEQKLGAIWSAVLRACERDDFRPRPSALCSWCSYRDICPAVASVDSPAALTADSPAVTLHPTPAA